MKRVCYTKDHWPNKKRKLNPPVWSEINELIANIFKFVVSNGIESVKSFSLVSKKFHQNVRSKINWQDMGYSLNYANNYLTGEELKTLLRNTQIPDDLPKITADLVSDDKSKYIGAMNHLLNARGGDSRSFCYVTFAIPPLITKIIKFIEWNDLPELQSLALQFFIRIQAACNFVLISHRSIPQAREAVTPRVIRLVMNDNTSVSVRERAITLLGFLSCEAPIRREVLADVTILKKILFGGEEEIPAIEWKYVMPFIPGIIKHITHQDNHVQLCAVLTLEEIASRRSDEEKKYITDSGVCTDLINILAANTSEKLTNAILKLFLTLSSTTDSNAALEAIGNSKECYDVMESLLKLFKKNYEIKQKLFRVLYNLAFSENCVKSMLEQKTLISTIAKMSSRFDKQDMKRIVKMAASIMIKPSSKKGKTINASMAKDLLKIFREGINRKFKLKINDLMLVGLSYLHKLFVKRKHEGLFVNVMGEVGRKFLKRMSKVKGPMFIS